MNTITSSTAIMTTKKNNYTTQVMSNKIDYSLPTKSFLVNALMDSGYDLGSAIDIAVKVNRSNVYRVPGIETAIELDKLGFIMIDFKIIAGKVVYSYIHPSISHLLAVKMIAKCKQ